MEIKVSVIIPVYNGGEKFRFCLQSLAKTKPSPCEIIVVADGGIDARVYPELQIAAQVIETSKPGGPARARNIGARAAKGDILFFIDADITVCPDCISRIEDFFAKNAAVSALFGSYDDAPAEPNFLSQYRNLLHHYVHQSSNEEASTFWGACGAIRRAVFLEHGGFDESLDHRPAIEDIELGYRLRNAGHKIRLDKNLQIKHLKRWGVLSMIRTDLFQRALPWAQLILRDRKLLNDLNTATASRLSIIMVFAILASLFVALWLPRVLFGTIVVSLVLFFLNLDVYRFYLRKRGGWFALGVIPWHWLYYLYSGLGLALGFARHILTGNRK